MWPNPQDGSPTVTSPRITGAAAETKDEGAAPAGRPEEATGATERHGGQVEPGHEKDIVEVTGEGSFPGSDPPSWSGAVAR